MHGNGSAEYIKEFVDKLKFNDIIQLVSALQEKFPKPTKWSDRADNSKLRAWLSTFSKFANLLSDGEEEKLLEHIQREASTDAVSTYILLAAKEAAKVFEDGEPIATTAGHTLT